MHSSMLKEYKCPNCGADVNPITGICPYCRSQFKIEDNNLLRIETYSNPIKVYKTSIDINQEISDRSNSQQVSDFAVKMLSRNLAEAIAPNMELQTSYDPRFMTQRVTARVRIVEPKYMF